MRINGNLKLMALLSVWTLSACKLAVNPDLAGGGADEEEEFVDACGNADTTDYSMPQPGLMTAKKARLEAAAAVIQSKCLSCHESRGNLMASQLYNPKYWNDPCLGVPHSFIGLDFDGYQSPMMQTVKKPAGAPALLVSIESMPKNTGLTLAEFNALWNFVEGLDDSD